MAPAAKQSWLRRLTGRAGRLVLLALALAAAWAGWWLGPWRPRTCWSRPSKSVGPAVLSPSGTSLLAVECRETNGFGPVYDSFRLWDLATGREVFAVNSPSGVSLDQAFAPDGSWLAAHDGRGGITIRDTADGHLRLTIPPAEAPGGVVFHWGKFAVSQDGRTLACWPDGGDPGVQLWDLATGRLAATFDHAHDAAAFAPDGRTLAAAVIPNPGEPNGVMLWDVARGREVGCFSNGTIERPTFLTFSPDGRRLAVVTHSWAGDRMDVNRYTVILWDLADGRPRATVTAELRNQPSPVCAPRPFQFSPDGRFLMIREEGTGLFWDLSADPPRNLDHLLGGTVLNSQGPPNGFQYPLFNAPGTCFVVPGPEPQSWVIHDAATLAPVATCRVGGIGFQAPVISPDGRLMAAAVGSSLAKPPVWEVWLANLLGRPTPLFGPPSRATVFDLTTGAELGRVPSGSTLLGFSPDGQSLWSYSQNPDPTSGGWALEVQQWALPSPRPPLWLFAVTALGVLLGVADVWRAHRRRRAVALP
jgi:WD40 repeat protein